MLEPARPLSLREAVVALFAVLVGIAVGCAGALLGALGR